MKNSKKIIATEFYDGPLEGFLFTPGINKINFFKTLAWDDLQDIRFYIIGQPIKENFSPILHALKIFKSPNNTVIINEKSLEANFIDEFQLLYSQGIESLENPEFFAIGRSLINDCKLLKPEKIKIDYMNQLIKKSHPIDIKNIQIPQDLFI